MYAFRKPFAAATFDGLTALDIDLKIWLITAQVFGYALSKFLGIKIISEMSNKRRAIAIIFLILIAELALLLFALVKAPWGIVFFLLNGIPLGLVWGIVFSYLEGRRTTEFLGAALCVSFIFSSGFVKSVGKWLMINFNITEFWMPFTTGLIFLFPLIFSVLMLDKTPPPSQEDIMHRVERKPMSRRERWYFFRKFAFSLVILIVVYMILTVFRDFRDNFAAEIWMSLGYGNSPGIFTFTEIPIAIFVLIALSLIMFIKNNRKALFVNLFIIFFGLLLIGISTLVFELKLIGGTIWMILVGLGLYLGYVPFNSILFDRMIASFRYAANVGFLIYLADSFGYLGSLVVLLYKNFGEPNMNWLNFFMGGAYVLSFIGMSLVILTMIVFQYRFIASGKTAEDITYSFPNLSPKP
jgi:MFS family permease